MITESPDIRWIKLQHTIAVLEIEQKSFAQPWRQDEVMSCLKNHNTIGIVAMSPEEEITGYCIYELNKAKLEIIRIAVAPEHRRCGVGYAIVDRLISKLENQLRTHIDAVVSLEFTAALAFFRRAGFIAVSVTGDLVRMRYAKDPDLTRWSGK